MSNFSNKISAATLVKIDGQPNEPGLYMYKDKWPWSIEMVDGKLITFQIEKGKLTGHTGLATRLKDHNWQRLTWPTLDHCFGWDITGWDLLKEMPSEDGYYLFITENSPPQIVQCAGDSAYISCPTNVSRSCFAPLTITQRALGRWAKLNPKTIMSSRCWDMVSHTKKKQSGFFLRKSATVGRFYLTKIFKTRVLEYRKGEQFNFALNYDNYPGSGEWCKLTMDDEHNAFWLAGYRRAVMDLPIKDSNLEQNPYYARGHCAGALTLYGFRGNTLSDDVKDASEKQSKRITENQARSMRAIFNLPEPSST